MKKTYRKAGRVYKTDEMRLNNEWKRKFKPILKTIKIPAFLEFLPYGYITRYIEGIDLQEDLPFQPRHDIVRGYPLNEKQREGVIKIFRDIVFAGLNTGYTLADFTKRNIILKGDQPYLIDYDIIIEGDLPEDYIKIFQKMIDYLELDYQFDGDLQKLYERIN